MREFARILCPVDFSESTVAGLLPAQLLARAFGADLFLLHVIEYPYESVAVERMYLEVEDAAGARLGELAELVGLPSRGSHLVVLRGTPYDSITRFAAEQSIDLIVMPTHGRAGLDRLLFGSVTERVLRMARCPVLAVPPATAEFDLERVLFATDFSPTADHAQEYARMLALKTDAELVVLHVSTLSRSDEAAGGWRFPVLPPEVEKAELEAAEKQLAQRAANLRSNGVGRVSTKLVRGAPAAGEIAECATDLGAGIVVVASHGHSAVARALLGSTSEKLVRISPQPVLVVRPADG